MRNNEDPKKGSGRSGRSGRRKNRGMMTLEAAVIVPVILVATILIFWTGVLLHDRAAARSAVSAAVLRGSERAELSNEELVSLMKEVADSWLEERLVMMEEPELEVAAEYGKLSASLTGRLEVPSLPFFGSAVWDVSASAEAMRLRESQIVRTIHRIDRVLEERKGEE